MGVGLVEPNAPVVRADDAGVTRGDGCFEGCRLHDGVIDKLDAHLARMTRSASALGIPFDVAAWKSLISEAVTAWAEPGEAAVKLLLTRGPIGAAPTGFVSIGPLPADYPRLRREGLKVITLSRGVPSDAFADAPWLLGGIKTLSYAVNMAAQREAVRRGADDVILVSTDGIVLEAPTSSVVWWDGQRLHTTPTGATGILASTTQRLLFERAAASGWDTVEAAATVDELHAADVVWLVGSVRGPVDVIEIDGKSRTRMPDVDAAIRHLAGFGSA
jgi:4-amino-4-deoxychorismate lyase